MRWANSSNSLIQGRELCVSKRQDKAYILKHTHAYMTLVPWSQCAPVGLVHMRGFPVALHMCCLSGPFPGPQSAAAVSRRARATAACPTSQAHAWGDSSGDTFWFRGRLTDFLSLLMASSYCHVCHPTFIVLIQPNDTQVSFSRRKEGTHQRLPLK